MTGIKISQLPAIAAPATYDVFPVVQAGVTYQESVSQLATIVSSNLPNNSVTNAMLSQMGAYTVKGNNTNGTANATDIAAGQLPATHTNDSASAGNVGEFIISATGSGAAVSLTTGTSKTVTSIALTAGDWDVWGALTFSPDASTTFTTIAAYISDVDNTVPTGDDSAINFLSLPAFATGVLQRIPTGAVRVSLAAPATYYIIAYAGFAVSTMVSYGFIAARRAR